MQPGSKSLYELSYGQPQAVCGNDERVRISPTTSQPYSSICELFVEDKDGNYYAGTGCIFSIPGADYGLVITAAHCLFEFKKKRAIRSIIVIPAIDGKNSPFGRITVDGHQCFVSYPFVLGKERGSDYGAILIPLKKGWEHNFEMNVLTTEELEERVVLTAGYPLDKLGETMWSTGDVIYSLNNVTFRYEFDTHGGQSGSPVWTMYKGKWSIVGIHSGGGCPNVAVRITELQIAQFNSWARKGSTFSLKNEDMNNKNYFPNEGGLKDIYADTNELICPPGQIMVGFSLYQKFNRIAPRILSAEPDGSNAAWITNTDMNNNYFPGEGGLKDIYADTNELVCPAGKFITGFSFWKKENRLAPRIRCSDLDGSNATWISNTEMNNNNYFPGEGGLKDIYADTNPLVCRSTNSAVTCFAFYKKDNRIAPMINTLVLNS
ncbi:hypothetical protein ECE50_018410 [Chitinophaga sp. Mgbs1]|uniref:Serine protease n=1 Tax=Chitinophaga solisilvae TaxID=1233460 RepID=A0A9Q5GRV8_9BACT|nr:hypothetical protein [Chitinophaga solisilvae]